MGIRICGSLRQRIIKVHPASCSMFPCQEWEVAVEEEEEEKGTRENIVCILNHNYIKHDGHTYVPAYVNANVNTIT